MSVRPAHPTYPAHTDDMPDVVLDAGSLVRHRPQRKYGRRSYYARCQRVAIEFPNGVSSDAKWLRDCPQCFPSSGGERDANRPDATTQR